MTPSRAIRHDPVMGIASVHRREGNGRGVNRSRGPGRMANLGRVWVTWAAAAKGRQATGLRLFLRASLAFAFSGLAFGQEKETGVAASEEPVAAFPPESKVPVSSAVEKPRKTPANKQNRVIRRVKEPSRRVRRVAPDAESTPRQPKVQERLGRPREGNDKAREAVMTHQAQTASGAAQEPGSELRAPYGRLIKCELVFTVDSVHLNNPIVALVTEDVWWEGRCIVPAGTEVFGRAVPNRVMNRIGDDGTWTLVLPGLHGEQHGREWKLKGTALDREELEVNTRGEGRAWSETDGSSGLQGFVIDEADSERVKLVAATLLSGAMRGFARGLQTRVPAGGNAGRRGDTLVPSTLRNAGLEAAGGATTEAIDHLAKQILAEIERNGAYVRVPAGKTFYLFVDQRLPPAPNGGE
ncbi:MAG: TrbI/VirB10 family protein [Opitutaceae bacterium]|nr:TrbI/VirB10 family protein [Opitutaceae bacterium]